MHDSKMEFFDVTKFLTGAFNPPYKCIPGLLILDQSSIFCNRYMPEGASDNIRLEINRSVLNCRRSLSELHRSARKTVMTNSTLGHVHPFNLNVGNRKSENKIQTWLVFHVSIFSKSYHILCQKLSSSVSIKSVR